MALLSILMALFPIPIPIQEGPINSLGNPSKNEIEIIGKLGGPLGQVEDISGVLVSGIGPKGGAEGLSFIVQKTSKGFSQQYIKLNLSPHNITGWESLVEFDSAGRPKLEFGRTYELRGYETGAFFGQPQGLFEEGEIGDAEQGFHFSTYFAVVSLKPIDPIIFTPSMFSIDSAIFKGIAKTINGHAAMVGDGWSVIAIRGESWSKEIEGKQIETHGTYRLDTTQDADEGGVFELSGSWRLRRLADQVGKKISLRGQLTMVDDEWVLHYRGTKVHVVGMENCPIGAEFYLGCPILVEGCLKEVPEGIAENHGACDGSDIKCTYKVLAATWSPLPMLLLPDKPRSPESFMWE